MTYELILTILLGLACIFYASRTECVCLKYSEEPPRWIHLVGGFGAGLILAVLLFGMIPAHAEDLTPKAVSVFRIKNIPQVKYGGYFGGGGVNYSTTIGGGQFDSRLKVNQLMMQWHDEVTQLNFNLNSHGTNIIYIRMF